MTPNTSAIIEQTIALQTRTNHLQTFTLALIVVCNIFIFLSVLNIRRAMRINREWTDTNAAWSKHLREASGMEARRAAAENTDAVHDSPTAESGDAQRPPQ